MRLILISSLYEIYFWPHKSREMLYSKHELVKLCTLVKIQDSESHTLVDGTYMLRSPESVHLYPLPFPTPPPLPRAWENFKTQDGQNKMHLTPYTYHHQSLLA